MLKLLRKIVFAVQGNYAHRVFACLLMFAFLFLWMQDRHINHPADLYLTVPTNYREVVNAHALETKGKNIPIAVIDSGFQRNHPDYRSNVDIFSHLTDYSGDHGSSVVSVITQIAPKCEIYFFNNSDPLIALERALLSPPRIINMSWSCNYETIRFILLRLAKAGKIIVMSAGNDGLELGRDLNTQSLLEIAETPELKGRLLLVASIEHRQGREYLSPYSNYAGLERQPLVCAPGSRILAAASDSRYGLRDGTSFAAPQVTGLLALLMEEFPYYPPEWYVALVKDAARKWSGEGSARIDPRCGHGIINAKDAIVLGRSRQKHYSTLLLKSSIKSAWQDIFMTQKTNWSHSDSLKSQLRQVLFQENYGSIVLLPYFERQLENQLDKVQAEPANKF